ncbi:hypothetical protein QM467_17760 [Rhodoblastus sp. 17X3]|uniref:hypothetical protein n=1 Tax=Rhodoblastus sp. 17X3 TaxID=3047026 RepID=UPI0024B68BDA|nr:hypothetical protein [Rhodoblastus sp. 17X3]MDI9849892.1 hypothetical protein [Rhodoblastus sp. 17X3]
MSQEKTGFWSRNAPLIISSLAMIGTMINAFVGANSFNVNKEAYQLNQDNLKTTVFLQLQQHYNAVAASLPEKMFEPDFRPEPGSADYRKILNYLLVCYAEWYETNKMSNGAYVGLWSNYYSGLIQNALVQFPSVRHVLEDMMLSYGTNDPNIQEFYLTMRILAEQGGKRLGPMPDRPGGPVSSPISAPTAISH